MSKNEQTQHSIIQKRKKAAETRAGMLTLTPRERQVLSLVVEGFANKKIAARLRMSIRTVEVHRAHIMRKMNSTTPVSLACDVQCANCEFLKRAC